MALLLRFQFLLSIKKIIVCTQLNGFKNCFPTLIILFSNRTRERWQWRGTLHSTHLQGWNMAIGLFNVISRTLIEVGVLPHLQRCSRCILQYQLTGLVCLRVCVCICVCICDCIKEILRARSHLNYVWWSYMKRGNMFNILTYPK